MRILHYFLGFPPYRTGGLTKFALDLMEEQVKDGNVVFALWPGQIKNYCKMPFVKERKTINGIRNLELINPLPVPLDEGIKKIDIYTKACDLEIYEDFLKQIAPDIIHIHTLMGMHKEFIQAANNLKIRTVFTTHDYFGLCPKVTFYSYGNCCDNDNNCVKCIQCNKKALSLKKIKLMQSPLYRKVKNTSLVKKIRKKHRSEFFIEESAPNLQTCDNFEMSNQYKKLRLYYTNMLESIDFIHFNSTLAKKIYMKYIVPKDGDVISISHKGIFFHERQKNNTEKKIIIFLASPRPFKGWNVLKKACDELWDEDFNFQLRIYGPVPKEEPYMLVNENGYCQNELEEIMKQADILVAPSVWYETFGFTVLEALSYGVPTIVSTHVGAKDLITDDRLIVAAGDASKLKQAIKNCPKNVSNFAKIQEWTVFKDEMYEIYRG